MESQDDFKSLMAKAKRRRTGMPNPLSDCPSTSPIDYALMLMLMSIQNKPTCYGFPRLKANIKTVIKLHMRMHTDARAWALIIVQINKKSRKILQFVNSFKVQPRPQSHSMVGSESKVVYFSP